jgi:hypothetical protein
MLTNVGEVYSSERISNEYQHSGLRDDGAMIFNKLLGMAKGEVGTPS